MFKGNGAYITLGLVVGIGNGVFSAVVLNRPYLPPEVYVIEVVVGFLLIWGFLVAKGRADQERADRMELLKHLMTLQHGKAEPPHDPTRLPPEMLKAFEKPGKEQENGQRAASA